MRVGQLTLTASILNDVGCKSLIALLCVEGMYIKFTSVYCIEMDRRLCLP